MKKRILLPLLVLCLLPLLAARAGAAEGDSGYYAPPDRVYELKYEENADGSLTITDWRGSGADDLVIPDAIDGRPVTAVGPNAFFDASNFRSLTLGSNLTHIGKSAFAFCSSLTGSLTLPDGLESIGEAAFYYCAGLTGPLTVPGSVTEIGPRAFQNCTGLTALTLEEGVGVIGSEAFYRCAGLTGSLTIPDSVTEIGDGAFSECKGFDGTLTLGGGLTAIGARVFDTCTGFTGDLTIPDGVTTIGEDAFYLCDSFAGSLTLPDSLVSIGAGAFGSCSDLTGGLTLPDGLTSIGAGAFASCKELTGSLVIPEGVTEIGGSAFSYCPGLDGTLTLPDGLTSIGAGAFSSCYNLTGPLVLPDGLTTIGAGAFCDCRGFTGSLVIPEGVTVMEDKVFSGCSSFTGALILPDGLTAIGDGAFKDCEGFTGSLVIPEGVTEIGNRAFRSCEGFTGSLVIPDAVTKIGDAAFFHCTGFDGTLTLGSGLTDISFYAFDYCYGFTGDLVIPDSVVYIRYFAFRDCRGFNGSLTLGRGLSLIDAEAFRRCSGLTGDLTIPGSVDTVGDGAFSSCSSLTSLTLMEGVSVLEDSAFRNCSGLEQISLPASLASIGDYALHSSSAAQPAVYFAGGEAGWADVAVNLEYNNMLQDLRFDGAPAAGDGEARLGAVSANTGASVTIDGVTYPLDMPSAPAENVWAGEYVLYTVDESGAVTGVTVLVRAAGTLDNWSERLSTDPFAPADDLVTLSGVDYAYSALGDRSFLSRLELLLGQRVIFYRDAGYTVYHLEPDPDSVVTRVGHVTSADPGSVAIDGLIFRPGEGLSVPEDLRGKFVKYELRGLTTLTSIQELATDIGTLGGWDAAGRTLTISQKSFSLSPLADTPDDELARMVGYKVYYTHDGAGSVYHAEWAVPDPGVFNEYIYRAGFLQNSSYDPTRTVNEYLAYQTPGSILLEAMEQEGFQVGMAVWEGITILADSAIDITNLDELNVMPRDLFSAIIMNVLEKAGTEDPDFSNLRELDSVIDTVRTGLSAVYGSDAVVPAQLTDAQREELARQLEAAFLDEFPDMKFVAGVGSALDVAVAALDVSQSVAEAAQIMANTLMLCDLSQSMKDLLRAMYDEAGRAGFPTELRLALMDCMEIINAADPAAALMEGVIDAELVLGREASKAAVSLIWWSTCRAQIQLAHPEVFVLQAAYAGSRLICNEWLSTDDIVGQYWELLATVEVENLVELARDALAEDFRRTGTLRDAQAYLSATSALFAARQLDCDAAWKYVDTVDEATASKILAVLGFTHEEIKSDIDSIRISYQTGAQAARWGWLEYAMDQYPQLEEVRDLYDRMDRLQKTLRVACPVDVYVYDRNGDLAAMVTGDRVSCSVGAPIALVVQGDVKTLCFYGDEEYDIRLVGQEAGDMDVTVTEYDGGTGRAQRTAGFYGVPLEAGRTYEAQVFSPAEGYALEEADGAVRSPDVDTAAGGAAVTARVENGGFLVDGVLVTEVTGMPGQEFTVAASLPKGWSLDKWTSDGGGTFADARNWCTTFRLPESGPVTLTAVSGMTGETVVGVNISGYEVWLREPGGYVWLNPAYYLERPTVGGLERPANTAARSSADLVWSASDPDIFEVVNDSPTRILRTLAPGTTYITATFDGLYSDTTTVVVRDYRDVTLTVRDGRGLAVDAIPDGPFTVEALVTGGGEAVLDDRCLLACYDADGRMLSLTGEFEAQVLADDVSVRLTFRADGGDVARIKLFFLLPWSQSWPLGPAAVFPAG